MITLVACAGFAGGARAQSYDRAPERHVISHGGASRIVGVYRPSTYAAERAAPLIIALHSRFSSSQAFHALSGLADVAEAHGAIIAYPETLGAFWNDGGHERLNRREASADDAGFIAAVVAALSADYSIDPARIFVVGYDTGGGLAYKLACERPFAIAGVAVVSALMWDYAAGACTAGPTPMLIVHGRRDDLFPVGGGRPSPQIAAQRLSVDETIAFWRRANQCGERPTRTAQGDSALYDGCATGARVAYVGIRNGGHEWFRDGADYRLNRHGVDAADVVRNFFFGGEAFQLPDQRGVGRRPRSYFVYAPPSYDPSMPMPVLVVLHGRPSTATGMALISRMHEVAARRGFIVVYPEGVNNEWNAFNDLIGNRAAAPQDDVAFLETLMDHLRIDLNIDTRRMYVSGFSNGGFMTLRMACSSRRFAGFASVGAPLYSILTRECRGPPAAVLVMHGTADPSVPYEGVIINDGQNREPTRLTLSAQETVGFFIRRNHCSYSGVSTTFAERGQSPGTHVVRFMPRDCDPHGAVAFYIINGGGHTWPGVGGVMDEATFGPTNMDINAGDVIWDFFSGLPPRDP